jgi:ankyrin repeat protein
MNMAIKRGDIRFVENALNNGLSPDFYSNFSMLFWASRYNNKQIALLLLTRGASVNKKNKTGETPVFVAARMGHVDMIKFLHENGANLHIVDNLGYNILLATLRGSGDTEIIDFILKKGVDINSRDYYNNNALNWGIIEGNYKAVEFLINKGIDVNATNNAGASAMDILIEQTAAETEPEKKEQLRKLAEIFKKHGAKSAIYHN